MTRYWGSNQMANYNDFVLDSFGGNNFTEFYSESKNTVFELAKAFLSIDSMTHKKLQKLCYYAKAWYLAFNDENIIEDEFEAWVHGAVQPLLFQKYKAYGFQMIPAVTDTEDISPEYLEFAKVIYDSYGKFSGEQLERLNHSEEPWLKARKGLEPWENSNQIIKEEDMKSYYRKLMKK